MTIRKKKGFKLYDNSVQLEEIISRGGHVAADNQKEVKKKKEWTNLCLRIPLDTVKNIDKELEERLGLSRTAWILESIQEKLRNKSC